MYGTTAAEESGVEQSPDKRAARRASDAWRARIGDGVRRARTQRKLSQSDLGALAGVDWTTISRIERGVRLPDLATIETIAERLGISIDELVGRAAETTPPDPARGTVLRLPAALQATIRNLQLQIDRVEEDARSAQATADEAKRLAQQKGRRGA